ncbi:MIP/aquaporin family protein [Flectobacillus sp. DC10W]|jgi:glycerol uptake facilitator protein|uniref:MIP/aquaporin family protein n=1 Tax=Flectobacillus longus TaxID=2984207 RepID=A0ABT6YPH6_9BACT|nr:MIP/aquaporin family protein [Flectobacillus longus]MDI9865490.1 MIP/aquaporin family protein [Flectobacillus longus]
MHSAFLGELIGTAVLIYLGNGVVANVLLKHSKGENAGWMVITTGWAMAVTIGIFVSTAFGSPAAHLNPAVTVAMACKSGDWSNAGSFILAQLLGGILGAALVWIHYHPHWEKTEDTGLKLACFSTSPAINKPIANLMSELLGTLLLIIVLGALPSVPNQLGPYVVGLLVWAIGLSLGGTTGYAINPARDLGPRIAHAILPIAGKGSSDWQYAWVPVVGPIIGAIIGGLVIAQLTY